MDASNYTAIWNHLSPAILEQLALVKNALSVAGLQVQEPELDATGDDFIGFLTISDPVLNVSAVNLEVVLASSDDEEEGGLAVIVNFDGPAVGTEGILPDARETRSWALNRYTPESTSADHEELLQQLNDLPWSDIVGTVQGHLDAWPRMSEPCLPA